MPRTLGWVLKSSSVSKVQDHLTYCMPAGDDIPFVICSVTTKAGGTIGLAPCPGLRVRSLLFSGGYQELLADLETIRDWGAVALVSLVEMEEMTRIGVAEMPALADQCSLAYYHLPIMDMDVPDENFEERWRSDGAELKRLLSSGQSIVIHCMAGLGRTGTIAARLLVELGEAPDVAIRCVRRARPGAIQTIQQERHIYRCSHKS